MNPTCICGSSSFFALSIIAIGVAFNSCCSRSPCWKNSSATRKAVCIGVETWRKISTLIYNLTCNMGTVGRKFLDTLTPAPVLTIAMMSTVYMPLFHFWPYLILPKLASYLHSSSTGGIRSFQWYPEQSYWLNGAWDMHENPQKIIWVDILAAKFPATSLSYYMVKMACLDDAFSEIFGLEASPAEGQSLPQKDRKMRKKKRQKKLIKTEKPQT